LGAWVQWEMPAPVRFRISYLSTHWTTRLLVTRPPLSDVTRKGPLNVGPCHPPRRSWTWLLWPETPCEFLRLRFLWSANWFSSASRLTNKVCGEGVQLKWVADGTGSSSFLLALTLYGSTIISSRYKTRWVFPSLRGQTLLIYRGQVKFAWPGRNSPSVLYPRASSFGGTVLTVPSFRFISLGMSTPLP